MKFSEFEELVSKNPCGVVLLEGRRNISEADAADATRLGIFLADRFPTLRFRSGNAEGSDQAFSDGIAVVDAGRLQIVAPYPSHRMKSRYEGALYTSPNELSIIQDQEVAYKTSAASPKVERLVKSRKEKGPLAAKANYLLRDTMKVLGHSEEFSKPICGIFFIDPTDPMAGGTGHTIRVCELESVPVVFQDSWREWK